MRQAGRYLPEYRELRAKAGDFLTLCYTSEMAAEVTFQPLRRYHFDAAILFSDILVIPDALGQKVAFHQGEGPVLSPLRDAAAIEALSLDKLHDHLAPVYGTMDLLAKGIPGDCGLIGFAGAPWTVATYMVEGGSSKDYAHAKRMAFAEPETFAKLIDIITEATAQYLIRQIDHGAEAIQIFDSWAGALAEDQFHRWVIKPTRILVERIKAVHPQIPIIGFPKGCGALYEAFAAETGVDAVSLDTNIPLDWAAKTLQTKVTVQGNLDPILLVTGGEALDQGIDRILNVLGHGPFIFNLGHGIVPQTPPENVARLIERVHGWKA